MRPRVLLSRGLQARTLLLVARIPIDSTASHASRYPRPRRPTRTRCIEGSPPEPAAAKLLAFARQWTCQNVSMEQFGQLLPRIAGAYTRVPVRDRTGLPGGYDFTLSFSTSQQVQQAAPTTDPGNGRSDSPAALSLGDAVRRQLGIRLVDTKRPVPVLVIDSISQTPTSN